MSSKRKPKVSAILKYFHQADSTLSGTSHLANFLCCESLADACNKILNAPFVNIPPNINILAKMNAIITPLTITSRLKSTASATHTNGNICERIQGGI